MPASRRLATTAALCLLGGAAATVLVAWACAQIRPHRINNIRLSRPTWNGAGGARWFAERYPAFGHCVYEVERDRRPPTPGDLWRELAPELRQQGVPGWVDLHGRIDQDVSTWWVDAAGWPALSLASGIQQCGNWNGAPRTTWAMVDLDGLPSLPLRPLWIGFTLDTLFYAAILAALFLAPPRIRRALRLRRGLCPACAYNLTGNTTNICPECGHATPPPSPTEPRP